ncbi:uncharacterized protein TNCV_1322851 [Trichonephila clavipes]|nr:uncharacterized protein TNCV_1322851 [Trichonephila clavipes]
MDLRAPSNSKNWQWTTEGNVSARRSTPTPHGDEWPYSFIQAVGNQLVYCYGSTNVGFVNSSTSAAPWITCKGAFIQGPPHGNPDACVCNGLMSTDPGKLIANKVVF